MGLLRKALEEKNKKGLLKTAMRLQLDKVGRSDASDSEQGLFRKAYRIRLLSHGNSLPHSFALHTDDQEKKKPSR